MGDVLVKGIGDKDEEAMRGTSGIEKDPRDKKSPVQVVRPESGKSTTNIEGSGFTAPPKGVNPAIVSPMDLTEDQLKDILSVINTEEYRELGSSARQAELDRLVSQAKTEQSDEETSGGLKRRFDGEIDMSSPEARKAAFIDRMRNIPGFLDMVFDLNGVDKDLAYRKMGRMNLSLEDIFNQLQNNELPTHLSEQEAAREKFGMEKDR